MGNHQTLAGKASRVPQQQLYTAQNLTPYRDDASRAYSRVTSINRISEKLAGARSKQEQVRQVLTLNCSVFCFREQTSLSCALMTHL